MIEAIAKRKSIRSFADKKVEAEKEIPFRMEKGLPENVKPYSIVGIGYPAEDADLEAVERFDAGRILL